MFGSTRVVIVVAIAGFVDVVADNVDQIVAGVSPYSQQQWPVGIGLLRSTLAKRPVGGVRHAGPSYEKSYEDFARLNNQMESFKKGQTTGWPIKPPWTPTPAGCEQLRAALERGLRNKIFVISE